MRSRYGGEASDTNDDSEQPQPARSSPSTNGRLNKNDFPRYNERLYEAYAELHLLAQGTSSRLLPAPQLNNRTCLCWQQARVQTEAQSHTLEQI
jgi:hypothetical protein